MKMMESGEENNEDCRQKQGGFAQRAHSLPLQIPEGSLFHLRCSNLFLLDAARMRC
jgi:hypothetical protein